MSSSRAQRVVGVTGTSKGATELQLDCLRVLLRGADELHHGDCVGADEQAHEVAVSMGVRVVTHPPVKDKARAWCSGDESREPADYLVRNKQLVSEVSELIALPEGPETLRSGTWATVRYARLAGIPVCVVTPEGAVQREPGRAGGLTTA